jgi:hypothetical protein
MLPVGTGRQRQRLGVCVHCPGLVYCKLAQKKVRSAARPTRRDRQLWEECTRNLPSPAAVGEALLFPLDHQASGRLVDRMRSVITWCVVIVVPPQSF